MNLQGILTFKKMEDFTIKFLKAQEEAYPIALSEIKNGKKLSHWMWFIFPQVKGLGYSEMSMYYAIQNLDEAKEYLNNEILGSRLKEISTVLLELNETSAYNIFGSPDDLKLKSSMTLFDLADGMEENLFHQVLKKFFDGERDEVTLKNIV